MSRITLSNVREEALDAITRLKEGKMDVKTAKEVRGLLDTITDTAKTEIDFLRVIPDDIKNDIGADGVKAIGATVQDKDADLDLSLKQIEKQQNSYEHPNNK